MEINKNSVKNMSRKIIKSILFLFYSIFIGSLLIGGISAGIMTIIPDEASKLCYLGYYAHCSFTPYSTIILFAMAIVGAFLLFKLIKYVRRQYNKVLKTKPILKNLIKK
jgi:flagellar biosynthesis protein FliQ